MPRSLDSKDAPADSAAGSSHRDLSAMIDAGRSFSGNERNCVFLNTRDGRFSDFSAGSGIDFPDDGRAIAVSDWDQDGDLDLWVSNRNAPRVRLMRNESAKTNHHLTVKLTGNGKSTNRDAIGARVEVMLTQDPSSHRLVKTLHAGEGFLSQSSKWLHFGLGEASEIEEILVRWPDGTSESFRGIKADQRYRLLQGSGSAAPAPRRRVATALSSNTVTTVAQPTSAARVPAVTLLRAPKLNIRDAQGRPTGVGAERHLLVNLWATWCAPCIAELELFRDSADAIQKAGVDVLALNLDGIGEIQAGAKDPARLLSELKFPFPATRATAPLLAAFQEFHDHLVGLNQPLPIPTSFLIDPQGNLSVIYKGPVTVDRLLADLQHSRGTVDERFQRSAPVAGTLIANPTVANSRMTHQASIEYRYGLARKANMDLEGAEYYLIAARTTDPTFAPAARELAQLYLRNGESAKAAAEFDAYLELVPDDALAHHQLAKLRSNLGQSKEALVHFEEALQLNPTHALTHFEYAALLATQGTPRKAVAHYRAGLKLQPANGLASNNLAWILATHPNPEIRDPAEALRIATSLNAATANKIPNILDTLAAAQATLGQYQTAATTARRAIALVEKSENQQLMAGLRFRLTLYEKGQPFREAVPANKP